MINNIDKYISNILENSFLSLDDINNLKVNTGLKQYFYLHNSYKIPLSISIKLSANIEEKQRQFENAIPIIKKFNQQKIDYLLIKGPVLSKYLYNDAFIKNYMDLDLFINPNYYEAACETLLKNGYNNNHLLCYDKSLIKENKLSYFLLLCKGDDNYFYNSNNGFEIKDFIRFISLDYYEIIKDHIISVKIHNIDVNTFDIEMTFVISMIYLYYSTMTYKGFKQKYKIDYLLEFIIFYKKYNKSLSFNRLLKLIELLKLNDILNALNIFLNEHFKINLFSNNKILYYDKYKKSSIYNHSFSDLCTIIENNCNDTPINKYNIIRNYNNNINYKYIIEHSIQNKNEIKFTIRYPRILSMISFEFIFLFDNVIKKNEFTFYEENIYEFRNEIGVSYIFNYYDNGYKVFTFTINNLDTYKKILYCTFLRKVSKKFYPLMEEEEKSFIKVL